MITFKEYLNWLTEARIDDAKAKYPQHVDAIDTLHGIDPDPQKKYLPWLVKQHVEGKLELPQTDEDKAHMTKIIAAIGNPTNRKVHGITNYQAMNWNDVKSKVEPSLGVKSKKEQKAADIESGISKIYDGKTPDGNKVEAFDLKSSSAAQNIYGGGRQLGGNKTNWCIASKGAKNLFGFHYGKPYTIHVDGDVKSPYAYHPDFKDGTITTADNDGQKDTDDVLMSKPELKTAIDAIDDYHKKFKKRVDVLREKLNSPNASSGDIRDGLRSYMPNDIREKALNHPNITSDHIKEAAENINYFKFTPKVDREIALSHYAPHVERVISGSNDKNDLMGAIKSGHDIGVNAVNNQNADSSHFRQGTYSWNKSISDSAAERFNQMLSHDNSHNVSSNDLHNAIDSRDSNVAIKALNHPNANVEHYKAGLKSWDTSVRNRASQLYYAPLRKKIEDGVATNDDVNDAINSEHTETILSALKHPHLSNEHIHKLIDINDPLVSKNVANLKNLNTSHIDKLIDSSESEVVNNLAKNESAKLTNKQFDALLERRDSRTALSKRKDGLTDDQIETLVSHPDANVRENIASNRNLTQSQISRLKNDPIQSVRNSVRGGDADDELLRLLGL